MIYTGKIEGGKIVLDSDQKLPPDGTLVRVTPVSPATEETIGQKLLKLAGKAEGCPPDSSLNVDHYLYGLPKK